MDLTIIKCAETGLVPPVKGVIVSAVALPAGFLTVNIEFVSVVIIIAVSMICEVPVALPTTVYSKSSPFKVNNNCPASFMLTWNNIR